MALGHDVLTPAPEVFLKEVLNGTKKRVDLVTINTDFFNGRRNLFSHLKNINPNTPAVFTDNQIWDWLNQFLSGLSGEAQPVEFLHQLIKEEKPERKTLNYYQDELTWSLPSVTKGVDWGIRIVVGDERELSRSYFIAKTPQPKRSLREVVSGFFNPRLDNPVDY